MVVKAGVGRRVSKKTLEDELIDRFVSMIKKGENVCYFGIDLVQLNYNPRKLAELAKQKGVAQSLGYLAEVSANATKVNNLNAGYERLHRLYKALEDNFDEWKYLWEKLPEWGKRLTEKEVSSLNLKWRIYSNLRVEEIEDFIDLYVTKDFTRYTPEERCEMRQRGVSYTRLPRSTGTGYVRDNHGRTKEKVY